MEKEEEKKELEECRKKKEEFLNGWKREKADFLNYKKAEKERMAELLDFAAVETALKLLPVLDNLEKAEKEIPEKERENQYLQGVLQVKSQLKEFLKSLGVEEIEAEGQKFNPSFHEAVQAERQSKGEKVLEVFKKGYKFKGKVIRPAKVKV